MHDEIQDVSIVACCRSRDEMRLIQELLIACGVTSYAIRPDVKSSIAYAADSKPDVALLTVEKDDAPMKEFFRIVRSHGFHGNRYLPIIVATWQPSVAQIRQAIEIGATEILSLPANTETMTRAIYRAVFVGRPFIDVATYFGPCRRRKQIMNYGHPNRRKSEWEYSHISVRPANVAQAGSRT